MTTARPTLDGAGEFRITATPRESLARASPTVEVSRAAAHHCASPERLQGWRQRAEPGGDGRGSRVVPHAPQKRASFSSRAPRCLQQAARWALTSAGVALESRLASRWRVVVRVDVLGRGNALCARFAGHAVGSGGFEDRLATLCLVPHSPQNRSSAATAAWHFGHVGLLPAGGGPGSAESDAASSSLAPIEGCMPRSSEPNCSDSSTREPQNWSLADPGPTR